MCQIQELVEIGMAVAAIWKGSSDEIGRKAAAWWILDGDEDLR